MRIEIPRDALADFCRRHRIRRLSFFGSVLREDFGPGSDVDVLGEFEPGARVVLRTLDAKTVEPVSRFFASVTRLSVPGEVETLSRMEEIGPADGGAFRIAVLLGTAYRLEVSAPGYEVAVKDLLRREAGTREMTIPLDPR